MSIPRLVTPATALPVSLSELKDHLRLDADYTVEDADLSLKLTAACSIIEAAIGYPLVHSVWDWHTAHWPYRLPHHQVSDVASVQYTDSAGVQATVATVYVIQGVYDEAVPTQYAGECEIVLGYGQSWPSVTLAPGEPIVTRFTSGWKDADAVPYPLKAAALLEAAHLYRNRESVTVGNTAVESKDLARGVDALIAPYRIWRF